MSGIKIQKALPLQSQRQDPEARLREAAKMYEQHFLNEMVKSMRKTIDHSQMTEPGMAEKIYTEQLDSQYVESWAGRGGVGLADMIYNQLQERFFQNGGAPKPQGPFPLNKGTILKIEESSTSPAPISTPNGRSHSPDVSFLYEWEASASPSTREVLSPYSGRVLQAFRSEDHRQTLKLEHDHGLVSTVSFLGQTKDLAPGDRVEAGQVLGNLLPSAKGLTWRIGQVES